MRHERWLLLAGALSAGAAVLHLAIIVGGANWYRFFGAGEGMARLSERGSSTPALITLGIAAILALWSAYAFSGAGLLPRFPLLRTGLILIATVYLLKGLLLIPSLILKPALVDAFVVWSSLIVLAFGIAHVIGILRAWPRLSAHGLTAH